MDDKFLLFENWFKSQKKIWSDVGITVTDTSYNEKADKIHHSYTIELSAKNSEGTIKLYESNGIYWFDLECVNFDKDEIFCISVDSENTEDISEHIKKFETVMT